jgi:hypothetical protein
MRARIAAPSLAGQDGVDEGAGGDLKHAAEDVHRQGLDRTIIAFGPCGLAAVLAAFLEERAELRKIQAALGGDRKPPLSSRHAQAWNFIQARLQARHSARSR